MTRRLLIFVAIVIVLLLPRRVWACACCAHPGEYQINFVKPDAYKLSVIQRMRFGTTAYLFTGEAEPDDAAKGLAHPVDSYSLNGSLVGNVWKLTFRNGEESGTLNLPLPAKMLRYAADIHHRRAKEGYPEPLLYKEWHFEGEVNETGFFKAGITARIYTINYTSDQVEMLDADARLLSCCFIQPDANDPGLIRVSCTPPCPV